VAGVAAFGDQVHLGQVRAHTLRSLTAFRPLAERLPGRVILGHTNFVFIEQGAGLAEFLLERSIVGFGLNGYRMPDAVRVSFGSDEENSRVVEAIGAWAGV